MSNRITERDLQLAVDRINDLRDYPRDQYTGNKPSPYNYHLSFAYGGVALHQFGAKGSGTRDVFGSGHITKRELVERLHAYIYGLMEAAQ